MILLLASFIAVYPMTASIDRRRHLACGYRHCEVFRKSRYRSIAELLADPREISPFSRFNDVAPPLDPSLQPTAK